MSKQFCRSTYPDSARCGDGMARSVTLSPSLGPGDRLPELLLPPVKGVPSTFYERFCGRPAVVLIAHSPQDLVPFHGLVERVGVLGIVSRLSQDPSPIPMLRKEGQLTPLLGDLPPKPQVRAWVLDETMRLFDTVEATDPQIVERILDRLPPGPSAGSTVVATAPVLMLPRVLDEDLCRHLITAHDGGNVASGLMRQVKGRPTLVPDPEVKLRRDHQLRDPELTGAVTAAVSRRVLPGIRGAFNYPVTQFEAFKVVSYDGETGGYFRRHRDNITPDARHRRFALSINLNEDYEGGYLIFPEFGPMRYRPPAGGAIVFSGNLLHEATDVIAGRRYVVISFLWGQD